MYKNLLSYNQIVLLAFNQNCVARHSASQADRQTVRPTDRQSDKMDRMTVRQTDRQTDRQSDSQTKSSQTVREKQPNGQTN